jgi:hypothetical protein
MPTVFLQWETKRAPLNLPYTSPTAIPASSRARASATADTTHGTPLACMPCAHERMVKSSSLSTHPPPYQG